MENKRSRGNGGHDHYLALRLEEFSGWEVNCVSEDLRDHVDGKDSGGARDRRCLADGREDWGGEDVKECKDKSRHV